jgi:hypothetical protein
MAIMGATVFALAQVAWNSMGSGGDKPRRAVAGK